MKDCNNLVKIYTDGACSKNPGPGGWAAILEFDAHELKQISGNKQFTTNNAMELTAAISALKFLKKRCNISLYTDSLYLKNGITLWRYNWEKNNWKNSSNKIVKNVELWKELIKYEEQHNIQWFWVKAHSNNYYNNLVDQIAVAETKKLLS